MSRLLVVVQYMVQCNFRQGSEHTVPQLADANEARHVLVKHLEASAVLFGLAGVAEAARPIENLLEGLEVNW